MSDTSHCKAVHYQCRQVSVSPLSISYFVIRVHIYPRSRNLGYFCALHSTQGINCDGVIAPIRLECPWILAWIVLGFLSCHRYTIRTQRHALLYACRDGYRKLPLWRLFLAEGLGFGVGVGFGYLVLGLRMHECQC